jgi:hypothetical protein
MFRFSRLEPLIVAIAENKAIETDDVADIIIPDTFPYINDGMFDRCDIVELNGLPSARYRRAIVRSAPKPKRSAIRFGNEPVFAPDDIILECTVSMLPVRYDDSERSDRISVSTMSRFKEAVAVVVRRVVPVQNSALVESIVEKFWHIVLHARSTHSGVVIDGMREIAAKLTVDNDVLASTSVYAEMLTPWECAFDMALMSLSRRLNEKAERTSEYDIDDINAAFFRFAVETTFLSAESVEKRIRRSRTDSPDDDVDVAVGRLFKRPPPHDDDSNDVGGSDNIIDDPFDPFGVS